MIDWNDTSTWRVMVVDDEPDNLEVVAETLEYRGAEVKTALNGKEALDVLEGFSPNLIVTDLSMPLINGWELRTRIKSKPELAAVPVLALSAHAIAGDKERALDAGFDGYLTKPVNIRTLLDDIRTALVKPVEEVTPVKPTDAVTTVKPVEETALVKASDETAAVKPVEEVTPVKPTDEAAAVKPVDENKEIAS
ncbi:MAG TPA: response regulator [Phototrophicaceae bacterium]|nr:response regulator [Phototrophicaceae bacterium]